MSDAYAMSDARALPRRSCSGGAVAAAAAAAAAASGAAAAATGAAAPPAVERASRLITRRLDRLGRIGRGRGDSGRQVRVGCAGRVDRRRWQTEDGVEPCEPGNIVRVPVREAEGEIGRLVRFTVHLVPEAQHKVVLLLAARVRGLERDARPCRPRGQHAHRRAHALPDELSLRVHVVDVEGELSALGGAAHGKAKPRSVALFKRRALSVARRPERKLVLVNLLDARRVATVVVAREAQVAALEAGEALHGLTVAQRSSVCRNHRVAFYRTTVLKIPGTVSQVKSHAQEIRAPVRT